jgi:hypothetical protein
MTPQEWKRRSTERILKALRKSGRACLAHRGPGEPGSGEGRALFHQALERLAEMKRVVIEYDEEFENWQRFVRLP